MNIGIDLGGTKIEIVVIDDNKEILFRKRTATPHNDYNKTIGTIRDLVNNAKTAAQLSQLKSIGIGTPGTVSPICGTIKNANSTWLNNKPLGHDLELALGCEVILANDANCMALSEAVDGSGSRYNIVFAIILGTGCGAGIAINKKTHNGTNGLGGEWGHNPLPWMDDDEITYSKTIGCYCGKHGCIENFLSGVGFARYYAYRCQTKTPPLNSQEIIHLANNGDTLALECIELYELRLAKALGHVINILDPDIIVAAGGMSNIDRIYPNVNSQLKNWVFGSECTTKLVKATHGDSSGVRGAAWLNYN